MTKRERLGEVVGTVVGFLLIAGMMYGTFMLAHGAK